MSDITIPRTVQSADNVVMTVTNHDTGETRTGSTHNVTCYPLHRQAVKLLNPRSSYSKVVDPPTRLAFGDDWGNGGGQYTGTGEDTSDPGMFLETDTALNNKVGEVVITDPSSQGRQISVSEHVGSRELNDSYLREVAIVTESGELWNHSPLPFVVEKEATISISLTIGITFTDMVEA